MIRRAPARRSLELRARSAPDRVFSGRAPRAGAALRRPI